MADFKAAGLLCVRADCVTPANSFMRDGFAFYTTLFYLSKCPLTSYTLSPLSGSFAAHFVAPAFRALIRVALADYEFIDTFILVVKCAPTPTP